MGDGGVRRRELSRWVLILFCAAAAGWLLGFRLPEERKNRMRKLAREVREMPFRVFV